MTDNSLYFEAHITIDPVFDDRLELFKNLCAPFGFKVADLILRKKSADPEQKHVDDAFCTGRTKEEPILTARLLTLIGILKANGFNVRRYKIEQTIVDSRINDLFHAVGGSFHD